MAFTADYLPKLGVRDRVHYVLGCNGGSGVVLMPWLGRAVGRRIAGTDDLYAILDVPRDADDVAIKKVSLLCACIRNNRRPGAAAAYASIGSR